MPTQEELDNFYGMIGEIQSTYPDIFALLNQPGVLDIALQIIGARRSGTPMTTEQMDAALHRTEFYRTTNQAAHDWVIQAATDPATAAQNQSLRAQEISAWMQSNGMVGSREEVWFMAAETLKHGETSDQWKYNIVNSDYGASRITGITPVGDQIAERVAAYGVPVSDLSQFDWTRKILGGEMAIETFDAYLREQAKSLYPGLTAAIDSGMTVREYVDPYAQVASRELGINPNDFNLSDQKWAAPIQQVDPKTGERTVMSLADWQSKIRTDHAYGYDSSAGAIDQASQFAASIAKQFGAM